MKPLVPLLLLLATLSAAGAAPKPGTLPEQFRNPGPQYRPMPFWHMNGTLTEEGVAQQLTDAKAAGFSGVAVLPVASTKPDFLGDGFFHQYTKLLDKAGTLGMSVILYDDTGFPSGTAGGKLEQQFPQHVRKTLEKHETVRTGPSYWKSPLPAGRLMAAVAMNTQTLQRIDLSPFIDERRILNWNVPAGEWRIMFFACNTGAFFKRYFPVDYLDPVAVETYMSLTYDFYAKRLGSHFGRTIELTFFDDVGFLRTERTWTNAFNEAFTALNGFAPTLYYPALWYDIGPETEAARFAFFNTRAELMAEGYPKKVKEWAQRHGLKNTGHPPGNYGLQPTDMSGDIFKYYRYTDLPLADLIIDYGHGRDGFKLISSAADAYDRPIAATEIYGAIKEAIVDVPMLYRALIEIQARGMNFVIPHGLWYDSERVSIPPLVSPASKKLGPALPDYSDYVARSCYMLQGGRRIADIAVLYPIASLHAGFRFDAPENRRAGTWAYPEADYLSISGILTNELRRDFTFVHPEFLASDKYAIRGDRLRLSNRENAQEHRVLIIPGGKVIAIEALKKIRQFHASGGKLIATTLLPSKSAELGKDREVQEIVRELFGDGTRTGSAPGSRAVFLPAPTPAALDEALRAFAPVPDVVFVNRPELKSTLGKFSYLHKERDGRHIYFFGNSTDDAISTEVLLEGSLDLEAWDPHTGKVTPVDGVTHPTVDGVARTKAHLGLQPVRALFWVGSPRRG